MDIDNNFYIFQLKMGTPIKSMVPILPNRRQLLALVALVMLGSCLTVMGRGPQTIDIDIRIKEEDYETYRAEQADITSSSSLSSMLTKRFLQSSSVTCLAN